MFYFLFLFSPITHNLNNIKLFCYILAKISENEKLNYINVTSRRRLLRAAILFLRLAIKFGGGCGIKFPFFTRQFQFVTSFKRVNMDKIRANIDQVKDYVHRKSVMRKGYRPVPPSPPSPPKSSSSSSSKPQTSTQRYV